MKTTPRRHHPRERGSILAVALLVSVFMVIVAIPFVAKFSSQFRTTEKSYKSLAALNLAEAGVERAIWELNYGAIDTWSGTSSQRTMTVSDFQASGGTVIGDISITVDNPGSANPVVESTGTVLYTGTQNIVKTLRIVLQNEGSPPLFDYGVFGNTNVTLANNALIDSYDSGLGDYGGANIHQQGNTGTNATGYGGIILGNNAVIQGDANTGYQSDPNQVIVQGRGSVISGEKAALDPAKELPSVTPPAGLPNLGNLSASGTATTISQSGQYNNFSLSINALVTVTADVTLYVTGTFTLSNNAEFRINPGCSVTLYFAGDWSLNNNSVINNMTEDPTKLVMYGTDTFTGTKTFCNNTETYAAMYFPRADMVLSNNAAIFGSVVANSISQNNNAPIHYDEALGDLESDPGTGSTFSVKSWQEKII